MIFNLTNLTSEPIKNQILNQYLQKILQDNIYVGKMLPTPRSLAGTQHVSITLIEKTYEFLSKEALVKHNGNGNYVVPYFTEIQKKIIRKKYLSSYSAMEVVEKFTKKLQSIYSIEDLCGMFQDILEEIFAIKKCQFIIKNYYNEEFEMVKLDKTQKNEEIHIAELFSTIISEQPISLINKEEGDKLYGYLYAEGYRLIYPMMNRNDFLGSLIISNKKNGDSLTCEDLNLLQVLVNQFIVSVSSARFYAEAVEKRRIKEEMQLARQIQTDLLPKNLPCDRQVSIAAYSKPAETVGGDFYDYIPIDENSFALIIGDASGKGLSAAMVISQIQALIKLELHSGKDLEEIFNGINKQMVQNIAKDKFLSLFIGIINRSTLEINYVNAGFCHPIIIGRDRRFRKLNSSGMGLRLSENAKYKQVSMPLRRGDTVVFYSDGIIESMDIKNQEFGENRLMEILKRNQELRAEQIILTIIDKIDRFTVNQKRKDDQTVMVLKIRDQGL
jgi:sigma-B regulation protein RsbU (phosphoserine phosphatase)